MLSFIKKESPAAIMLLNNECFIPHIDVNKIIDAKKLSDEKEIILPPFLKIIPFNTDNDKMGEYDEENYQNFQEILQTCYPSLQPYLIKKVELELVDGIDLNILESFPTEQFYIDFSKKYNECLEKKLEESLELKEYRIQLRALFLKCIHFYYYSFARLKNKNVELQNRCKELKREKLNLEKSIALLEMKEFFNQLIENNSKGK